MKPSEQSPATTIKIGDDPRSIPRVGFGTMRLCGPGTFGLPADPATAREALSAALQGGAVFIDTADCYGPGVAEQIVGEVVHNYGGPIFIATKGGVEHPGPGIWKPNGRPEHLRRACEQSLRHLGVPRIDLYQLHTVDPDVPLEESYGALSELRRAGKVGALGLSNVSVDQLHRAHAISPVASVQNRYNLFDRSSEDVLVACEALGITFIPWRPIAMASDDIQIVLRDLADSHSCSPSELMLAWLLNRSPNILPIPGTSTPRHAATNATLLNRLPQIDVARSANRLEELAPATAVP